MAIRDGCYAFFVWGVTWSSSVSDLPPEPQLRPLAELARTYAPEDLMEVNTLGDVGFEGPAGFPRAEYEAWRRAEDLRRTTDPTSPRLVRLLD